MRTIKVYDILSPDGFGMYMDKVFSTSKTAEEEFYNWIKRFEHQGYYRDNQRNMIPLDQLRMYCKLVDFEIELDEFDGEII